MTFRGSSCIFKLLTYQLLVCWLGLLPVISLHPCFTYSHGNMEFESLNKKNTSSSAVNYLSTVNSFLVHSRHFTMMQLGFYQSPLSFSALGEPDLLRKTTSYHLVVKNYSAWNFSLSLVIVSSVRAFATYTVSQSSFSRNHIHYLDLSSSIQCHWPGHFPRQHTPPRLPPYPYHIGWIRLHSLSSLPTRQFSHRQCGMASLWKRCAKDRLRLLASSITVNPHDQRVEHGRFSTFGTLHW